MRKDKKERLPSSSDQDYQPSRQSSISDAADSNGTKCRSRAHSQNGNARLTTLPVTTDALRRYATATKRMRVLVTGGAGFLGSHLCEALLSEGHSVICVDNLLTGRMSNIAYLSNETRFEFQKIDVCEPFDVGRIDYVFHFASPASPQDYLFHGIATLRAGSHGTFHALELARKYQAGFLLASTSECYGDPEIHPQNEAYWGHVNPIGPRSVYDEAKRFSEAATMAFCHYHNVNTRIVRIFNTYGPRLQLHDGRVISNFMRQALLGESLTVYGDGTQTRSFCYVADEIDGILRLSRITEHLPVNIGNPREFTVLECAKHVIEVTGSASTICFLELPEDDPKRRCPDITKARRLLGWEPTIDLHTGLKRSLSYFADAVTGITSKIVTPEIREIPSVA